MPDRVTVAHFQQTSVHCLHMPRPRPRLRKWFGPACKQAGVELYFQRSAIYSDADRDLLKHPGMTGFMVGF